MKSVKGKRKPKKKVSNPLLLPVAPDLPMRVQEALELGLSDRLEREDWIGFDARYQLASWLKKYPLRPDGVSADARRQKAIDLFVDGEQQCKVTNAQFDSRVSHDPLLRECESRMRRIIGSILGDLEVPSIETLKRDLRFGPGSAIRLPFKRKDLLYKFGERHPTVTRDAAELAIASFEDIWPGFYVPRIEDAGWITTVPKDAEKDRSIECQSLWNVCLQKAVGRQLRKAFKKLPGLDLDNGWRENRKAALQGSLGRGIATGDLQNASNTIAFIPILRNIPEPWFNLLDSLRHRFYTLDKGQSYGTYEMFSAMGNGFTFELESLFFWAILRACCGMLKINPDACKVFGDDLIYPDQAAELVAHCLTGFGFTFNMEKSFSGDNPFRESCGGHYYEGHDVTPLYCRGAVDTQTRLFWLANSIATKAHRASGGNCRDDSYLLAYIAAYDALDPSLRKPICPWYEGETLCIGGVAGDLDEVCPDRSLETFSWRYGRYVDQCKTVDRADFHGGIPALLKALYTLESREGRKHGCEASGVKYKEGGPWLRLLSDTSLGEIAADFEELGSQTATHVPNGKIVSRKAATFKHVTVHSDTGKKTVVRVDARGSVTNWTNLGAWGTNPHA